MQALAAQVGRSKKLSISDARAAGLSAKNSSAFCDTYSSLQLTGVTLHDSAYRTPEYNNGGVIPAYRRWRLWNTVAAVASGERWSTGSARWCMGARDLQSMYLSEIGHQPGTSDATAQGSPTPGAARDEEW